MAYLRGTTALCFIIIILLNFNDCAKAEKQFKEIDISEEASNYPLELARKLIRELKSKDTLFNFDTERVTFTTRLNDFTEAASLCSFEEKVLLKAKDRNGVKRAILNDPEDPVQRFRTEICKTEEASCSGLLQFIPGYRGVCVQKMALREMIYLDGKTNSTAVEYFPIPTCCSCGLFMTI